MQNIISGLVRIMLMVSCSVSVKAQDCEILNRVYADGSMWYFIQGLKFYWTSEQSLYGGILTDGDQYYIGLQPFPVVPRDKKKKLNDDLKILLSNDSSYTLPHYDTDFLGDTAILLLYQIKPDQLDPLLNKQVISATFNLGEGVPRVYRFDLHKDAIINQLQCFVSRKIRKNK